MWVTGYFAGVLDTCTFYGCSVFHLFGCLDVYSAPYEFSYFLLLSFFPLIFRCCLLAFYLLLLATLLLVCRCLVPRGDSRRPLTS